MTTNHNYQQPNLKKINKNKLSKQLEQEQNHRHGCHLESYQLAGGKGRIGEKVEIQKHNCVGTKQTGEVKNSIGNREAKELTCTTHAYELRRGDHWRGGDTRQREAKGENWNNCNSTINKIHFKKKDETTSAQGSSYQRRKTHQ